MGVITLQIPQSLKRTFRITSKEAASLLIRELEKMENGDSVRILKRLSAEVDRWEKEQDESTSQAIKTSKDLRKNWARKNS